MFTVAGLYCKRRQEDTCPLSWWGHPICGPCNCPTDKGFDPSCNKTTGECVCKVGTVFALKVPFLSFGRGIVHCQNLVLLLISLCDLMSCNYQEDHFRPTDSDTCYACECYTIGSYRRSCDPVTGQCPCRNGVIGRRCDACASEFAEVTLRGCEGKKIPELCAQYCSGTQPTNINSILFTAHRLI